MGIIMEPFFFLILIIGILSSLTLVLSCRALSSKTRSLAQQPPTLRGFPYSRRNHFFSAAERSFYEILRRLTPEHTIFAKVRLAELVSVKGSLSRQAHLNRLDRKQVDFVVCDKNLAPVVAIELDDPSHHESNPRARDRFVDEVLAAAALP